MSVSFFVPGIPKPQGSHRAWVNPKTGRAIITETNKGTRDWRGDVKALAQRAMGNFPMLDGPVVIRLNFVMKRPVSTSKSKPTPPAVKRPDLDKCARAIFDAITGVVYNDDSQVVDLHATKRIAEIGEQPGCQITVGVQREAS